MNALPTKTTAVCRPGFTAWAGSNPKPHGSALSAPLPLRTQRSHSLRVVGILLVPCSCLFHFLEFPLPLLCRRVNQLLLHAEDASLAQ